MGYIYKITNKINGKVYIGQTKKTIEERFQEHLKKAKIHTNRYLYDAMNKYGYNNFQVSKIEECNNAKLDEREIYWIAYYKSNNKKYGYNMTAGGGGGDTWTNNPHKEEISKKLSQAQKNKKHNKCYYSAVSKIQYYKNFFKFSFFKIINFKIIKLFL